MTVLERFYSSINKRVQVLEQPHFLSSYLQPHAFNAKLELDPFPFVVIDDFFLPQFAEELTKTYNSFLSKGLSLDPKEISRFHLFEEKINYDGFVYTPSPTLSGPLQLFYSVHWNLFFSKLFNKPTTLGTNFAFHHHPTGDRTGWIHHDYATHFFPHKAILSNGVTTSRGEIVDTEHSTANVPVKKYHQKRAVALIYYFNNSEWHESKGGETGLFESKDPASLRKKVAPINNRLLAFDVSPYSFHAFQQNFSERNTLVQWFHVDLDWCEKKYGFL